MTDPFLEDLGEAVPRSNQKGYCKVCDFMATMPDTRREALSSAISRKISGAKISKIMTNHGYPTSETAVRRHRAKGH